MKKIKICILSLLLLNLLYGICYASDLSDAFLSDWKQPEAYEPYPILFVHGISGHCVTWGGPDDEGNIVSPKGSIVYLKEYFKPYRQYQETLPNGSYPIVPLSAPTKKSPLDSVEITEFPVYHTVYLETIEFSDNNMHPINQAKELAWRIAEYNQPGWSFPMDKEGGFEPVREEYYGLHPTPEDKVIIVGHSMGGLSARDYLGHLCHDYNYDTHVAKLITVDTSHWGSQWATLCISMRNWFNENSPKYEAEKQVEKQWEILYNNGTLTSSEINRVAFGNRMAKVKEALDYVDSNIGIDTQKYGAKALDSTYNLSPHIDSDYAAKYNIPEGKSYLLHLRESFPKPADVEYKGIWGRYTAGSWYTTNPYVRLLTGWFLNNNELKSINFSLNKNLGMNDVEEWKYGDGVVSVFSQKFTKGKIFPLFGIDGEIAEEDQIEIPKPTFHSRVLLERASYDRWNTILEALEEKPLLTITSPTEGIEVVGQETIFVEGKVWDYLPAHSPDADENLLDSKETGVKITVYVNGEEQDSDYVRPLSQEPVNGIDYTENGKYNAGFSIEVPVKDGVNQIQVVATNAAGKSTEAWVNYNAKYLKTKIVYEHKTEGFKPIPEGTKILITQMHRYPVINPYSGGFLGWKTVEDLVAITKTDKDGWIFINFDPTRYGGEGLRITVESFNTADNALWSTQTAVLVQPHYRAYRSYRLLSLPFNLQEDKTGIYIPDTTDGQIELWDNRTISLFCEGELTTGGYINPFECQVIPLIDQYSRIYQNISDYTDWAPATINYHNRTGSLSILDTLNKGYRYIKELDETKKIVPVGACWSRDKDLTIEGVTNYGLTPDGTKYKLLVNGAQEDEWNRDRLLQGYGNFLLNKYTTNSLSYKPDWNNRTDLSQAWTNGWCEYFSSIVQTNAVIEVRTKDEDGNLITEEANLETIEAKGLDNEAAIAGCLRRLSKNKLIWQKLSGSYEQGVNINNIYDFYKLMKIEDFAPLSIDEVFVMYGLKPKLISVSNTHTTRPLFNWSRNGILDEIVNYTLIIDDVHYYNVSGTADGEESFNLAIAGGGQDDAGS